MGKDDEPSDGEINGLRLRILMLEKQLEGSTFWVEGEPFTTCSVLALEVLKETNAIPTARIELFANASDSLLQGWAKAELKRRKEEGDEREPWVRWRSVPVCAGCWTERNPGREPARVKDAPGEDCIVCDERTTAGIYVRMRVEWR